MIITTPMKDEVVDVQEMIIMTVVVKLFAVILLEINANMVTGADFAMKLSSS